MEGNEEENQEQKQFQDEEIANILRDALKMRINDSSNIPKKNKLNIVLSNSICEFMSCYRLLGFDMDGNPVNMIIYHSPIEKAALEAQFLDEISKYMMTKR